MWELLEDRRWELSEGAAVPAQVLRLLKVLGAGNGEASDQMSDILAQVRWSRPADLAIAPILAQVRWSRPADLAGLWATKEPPQSTLWGGLFVSS